MIKEKLTVYYNLQESLYSISLNGIEYFFSSEYNLNRFKFRLEQSRNDMKKSFVKKKYPVTTMVEKTFDLKEIADLNLYIDIEKKGFYIQYEGEYKSWQELLVIVLQNATKTCYLK